MKPRSLEPHINGSTSVQSSRLKLDSLPRIEKDNSYQNHTPCYSLILSVRKHPFNCFSLHRRAFQRRSAVRRTSYEATRRKRVSINVCPKNYLLCLDLDDSVGIITLPNSLAYASINTRFCYTCYNAHISKSFLVS